MRQRLIRLARLSAVCFASLLMLTGCQTAYYKTMESFGVQKRQILVSRVKEARDGQEVAKQQFKNALEEFSSVVNFKGGALEEKYKTLQAEYDRCADKASAVKKRIDKVEDVGGALFREWERELAEYTNESLRQSSRRQLDTTRTRYDQLIGAMRRAEQKIQPVLTAFKDQVLYLKHNLNAQAIASLQREAATVESDVSALIREMERSIAEADEFIKQMGNN